IVEDGHQRIYVRQAEFYFKGDSPITELTMGAVSFVKGKGSIEGDSVNFEFAIERNRKGSFKYEDKKFGFRLECDQVLSFTVIDEDTKKISFHGAGLIYRLDTGKLMNKLPLNFVVTVQDDDKPGKDVFSIKLLDQFDRSGVLSSGDIEVRR
ncbi:MAG: hypothetical protein AB1631_15485, partial [Acidobacteriota bacterium]